VVAAIFATARCTGSSRPTAPHVRVTHFRPDKVRDLFDRAASRAYSRYLSLPDFRYHRNVSRMRKGTGNRFAATNPGGLPYSRYSSDTYGKYVNSACRVAGSTSGPPIVAASTGGSPILVRARRHTRVIPAPFKNLQFVRGTRKRRRIWARRNRRDFGREISATCPSPRLSDSV